jgi:hypothetical protein
VTKERIVTQKIMAKIVELAQMRKMMKTDVPECNWQIWQDSKHANLFLPNFTALLIVKTGPKTVSATPKISESWFAATESEEFTAEVEKASKQSLSCLTYEQLVEVVRAMLVIRKPHVKHEQNV